MFGYLPTESKAQKKYFTRNGSIVFFSKAPLEDIRAINNQANCIYDVEANKIVAKVLIKAFEFEKSLMQRHFNESYLESDKYPKASFKGQLQYPKQLDFNVEWEKNMQFNGEITIHGVTKAMAAKAILIHRNGKLKVVSEFDILLKDFEINIPLTVINNISEKVKIYIEFILEEL